MPYSSQISLAQIYEIDEFIWLEKTIKLLKSRSFEELDVENLIEELENLGKRDFNRVKSLLRQIIIHLLLLEYWKEEYDRNHRHWKSEIIAFRADLRDHLTKTLENKLKEDLDSIYQTAFKIVLEKTGLSKDIISANLTHSFEQLLDEDWYPELREAQ